MDVLDQHQNICLNPKFSMINTYFLGVKNYFDIVCEGVVVVDTML